VRSFVLVLLAAVCFGTTGTAHALGPDATPSAVGLARVVCGGAALGLLALWFLRRHGAVAIAPRELWPPMVAGAAGMLAYQPTFFLGTSENGVAVGTVVALGSAPVLTGVLEWTVTRRRPTAVWGVATVVAVVGVGLLAGSDGGTGGPSVAGLLGSLGAGLSYAVYAVASKRLLDAGVPQPVTVGGVFGLAALGALPFLLLVDLGPLASGAGVLLVGWLGLVTVAVAYVLFVAGLAGLRASTVSSLTLAEPVTACLLGVLVLDERLTGQAALGVLAVALSVVLLALGARRAAVAPA
jgi:DME family drug/metabolite transporter